jgi:hypothetical protein
MLTVGSTSCTRELRRFVASSIPVAAVMSTRILRSIGSRLLLGLLYVWGL